MVDWIGIHSVTITMHEGMLLLAVIAVVVRFLVNILPKIPVAGWFFSEEFLQKTARISETVAFVAALGGTLGIVVSAITGTILSTPEGIVESTIVSNKVMVSIFALVFWTDFLVIRLSMGEQRIWTNRILQFFYPLLGVIGFTFVTVAGSIGGTLAGKESIIDFGFQLLGIHKNEPWIFPPITEFSRMVVNSPLQYLVNVQSMLQIIIALNVIIVALVLIYISVGSRSKATSKGAS